MSSSMTVKAASVVFPSEGYQALSTLVHLLGCSVLSFCAARRLEWSTIIKFCTIAIFVDSWCFVFSGGVLVSGIGMSLNGQACLAGVYLCIVFYAASKILIYILLSEKVHLVWSAGIPVRRFHSRIWILCAVVLLGYGVILVLMLIGRVGYLNPPDADGNQSCIIGLEPMASIPLLSYDCFLNIFLTSLFVYPLLSRNFWGVNNGSLGDLQEGRKLMNPKLRALAKRTCYAASVALTTSIINILILTILHGRQLGWICLASCGVDVTVNAVAIFLITRRNHSDERPAPARTRSFDKDSSELPSQGAFPHNVMTLQGKHDEELATGTNSSQHPQAIPFTLGRTLGPLSPKSFVAGSAKHRKSLSSPKHHQNPHQHGPRRGTPSTKRPSTGGHGGGQDEPVTSRGATLSQLGDFATTRDDGEGNGLGSTTSTGSVTGVGWAAGLMGGRASRNGLRKDMRHAHGGRGNTLQMVPVLVQADNDGVTSTVSLGDLQEENSNPRGSESIPKVYAFDDEDEYDERDKGRRRGNDTSFSI